MDKSALLDLYGEISAEQLSNFAEQAGLGGDNPADLREFRKILSGKHKILEVGCGTGRLGKHLVKDYKYTGIDINQEYLNSFSNYLKKIDYDPSKLIENKYFLEYDGSNFDAILFPMDRNK